MPKKKEEEMFSVDFHNVLCLRKHEILYIYVFFLFSQVSFA